MSKKTRQTTDGQGDLLPAEEARSEKREARSEATEKRSYEPNPIVTEIPATCPRCKSMKSKVLCTTNFPHRPLSAGNVVYPGRTTRRRICDDCGCRFISNAPSGKPRNSTA